MVHASWVLYQNRLQRNERLCRPEDLSIFDATTLRRGWNRASAPPPPRMFPRRFAAKTHHAIGEPRSRTPESPSRAPPHPRFRNPPVNSRNAQQAAGQWQSRYLTNDGRNRARRRLPHDIPRAFTTGSH